MWKRSQMNAYLATCAFSEHVANNLWQHCNPTDNPCGEIDKTKFIPALWLSDNCMETWIDAPMHLLFQGVISNVVVLSEKFMSNHKLKTNFERIANDYLNEIQSVRLDWLRVKPLPKTRWLAQDDLGFSRVLPFIYGLFFERLFLPESMYTTNDTLNELQRLHNSLHVMIAMTMTHNA